MSELTADISAIEELIAAGTRTQSFGREGLLMAWAGAYALALGLPTRARPWIDVLRAKARVHGHAWRVADAMALRKSVESRTARGFQVAFEPDDTDGNWIALRRTRLLRLRHSLLTGDFKEAHETADAVEADLHTTGVYRMPPSAFATLVAAHLSRTPADIEPPQYAGLENLGAILAGAEAVAMTGAEALADRWADWLDSAVPVAIRSAADWPTSRARISALLALRRGDEELARNRLMESIEWAESEGYEIEADLARVQLAELTRPSRSKTEPWARLRAAGVDPAVTAYWAAACRAHAARRADLTHRELEVLSLLRDGCSAREVGEALGLSPKTVANHAQSIYEKLGVRGRAKALARARTIGLI